MAKYCTLLTLVVGCLAVAATAAATVGAPGTPTEAETAVEVKGTFFGQLTGVPREQLLRADARVVVNGGEFVTFTTSDGSFVLRGLPEGAHVVDVDLGDFLFPQLQIRVSAARGGAAARRGAARVSAMLNDGSETPLTGGDGDATPATVRALGRLQFFVPREQYSIGGLLKNPMVLMMGFTALLMGMMKLMPQDELRQQMREMQQQVDNSKTVLSAVNSKKSN